MRIVLPSKPHFLEFRALARRLRPRNPTRSQKRTSSSFERPRSKQLVGQIDPPGVLFLASPERLGEKTALRIVHWLISGADVPKEAPMFVTTRRRLILNREAGL